MQDWSRYILRKKIVRRLNDPLDDDNERKVITEMIDAMISDDSFLSSALDSVDMMIQDGYVDTTDDDRLGKCLIFLKGIAEGRTQMLSRIMDPSQPILESKYVKMESEIFKSKTEEVRQKILAVMTRKQSIQK